MQTSKTLITKDALSALNLFWAYMSESTFPSVTVQLLLIAITIIVLEYSGSELA